MSSLGTWGAISVKAYDGTDNVSMTVYSSSDSIEPFRPGLTSAFWGYSALFAISNNSTVFYGNSTTTTNANQFGVIIGDGDTQPDVTDYKLSGNIITSFTATTAISQNVADGKVQFVATYNITNTGSDPIVIKEIGLTRRSQVYAPQYRILLTHDLLATPVTIAPGDTGVVTYKIEIS